MFTTKKYDDCGYKGVCFVLSLRPFVIEPRFKRKKGMCQFKVELWKSIHTSIRKGKKENHFVCLYMSLNIPLI